MGELIPAVRAAYGLAAGRGKTVVSGISMGGLGALRLGLKHPDVFGGLAALEAGIEPALRFADVKLRNSFQRGAGFLEARYGAPVDEAFWQAENPANIAIARRDAIVASGVQIYLEVGDADMFHLDEGVEFMHRVLWDHAVARTSPGPRRRPPRPHPARPPPRRPEVPERPRYGHCRRATSPGGAAGW